MTKNKGTLAKKLELATSLMDILCETKGEKYDAWKKKAISSMMKLTLDEIDNFYMVAIVDVHAQLGIPL